jgi:hypothetical protein
MGMATINMLALHHLLCTDFMSVPLDFKTRSASWVKQLRGLNRIEQLDLSMCIQASYSTRSTPDVQGYVPGET